MILYILSVQRVFRLAGTVSKKTGDETLSQEILVGLQNIVVFSV
jgi:hypothetical protein